MTLTFPEDFAWGTTTSAAQIETASDHNFRGLHARDGGVFGRTTDHEKRRAEDAEIIARFGTVYTCSVDWAALQRQPYAAFEKGQVAHYREFFADLRERGVRVMMTLHHFAHPAWFEATGGWVWESNLEVFYDYVARVTDAFGDLVHAWNIFHEPNTFALNAYYRGVWPPYEKSLTKATRVAGNMGQAYLHVFGRLKQRFPDAQVGYTLGSSYLDGRGLRAQATARLVDWWYYTRCIRLFVPADFIGIGYFAHIPFAPTALDVIDHRRKIEALGLPHDDMYALKPEGLAYNIVRAHRDTGKPIWVISNGVCTGDDAFRQNMLSQYVAAVHGAIRQGVPVIGYNVWSPWDNFEWHLGPSYRYGLMRTDAADFDRINTGSADWYEALVQANALEL